MRCSQNLLVIFARLHFLLLVAWLLLVHEAAAFTILPSAGNMDARWRDLPIRFQINYANSPYDRAKTDALLRDAFGLWNSVSQTSLRIELGGETDAQAAELLAGSRAETAVVFDAHFAETLGVSTRTVLAVGTSAHVGDRYVQGIVLVNAQIKVPDEERLKLIIAHETGHVFGLGHTSDESALMYQTARPKPLLSEDDALGVSYLYPRKEPFEGGLFGCGAIRRTDPGERDGPDGRILLATAWFAAFLLAWRLLKGEPA